MEVAESRVKKNGEEERVIRRKQKSTGKGKREKEGKKKERKEGRKRGERKKERKKEKRKKERTIVSQNVCSLTPF